MLATRSFLFFFRSPPSPVNGSLFYFNTRHSSWHFKNRSCSRASSTAQVTRVARAELVASHAKAPPPSRESHARRRARLTLGKYRFRLALDFCFGVGTRKFEKKEGLCKRSLRVFFFSFLTRAHQRRRHGIRTRRADGRCSHQE